MPGRRRRKPRRQALPGEGPPYPEDIGRGARLKRKSSRRNAAKAMPAAAPKESSPRPEEGIGRRRRRNPHPPAAARKSPPYPKGTVRVARQMREGNRRNAAKALPAQGRARTRRRETRARQRPPRTPELTAANKNNQEPHYILVICWRLRASYCYNSFRERSMVVRPRESGSPS